jgi:peptidoglycan L-alanyl-D-glutamate endopeptidase CwlK
MADFLDISTKRIQTLDQRLIPSAMRVLDKCWKDKVPLYIVWGRRSVQEQNLLFRYSRTAPGYSITTRRGGFSAHNYGLALDFCLLRYKRVVGWEDVYDFPFWRHKWFRAVKHFEEEGWESGWRWPTCEPGHVENLFGKTINQLYEEQQDKDRIDRLSHIREQDQDQGFYF